MEIIKVVSYKNVPKETKKHFHDKMLAILTKEYEDFGMEIYWSSLNEQEVDWQIEKSIESKYLILWDCCAGIYHLLKKVTKNQSI